MKSSKFVVAALAVFAFGGCAAAPAAPTGTTAVATPPAATSTLAATASASPAVATTAPAASASAIDLCSLLSVADIQAVIPGSWLEGQLTKPVGGYCHWDNTLQERVITAIEPRPFDAVKAAAVGGTDFTAAGHPAYSIRDEAAHVQTTWIDLSGQVLIVEIPASADAAADLSHAQALAGVTVGNM
jgi:hypothetical protein